MNPHYNQNYTRDAINRLLAKIKESVEKGRYTISLNENRQENIAFINEYNIRSEKQRAILLQIQAEERRPAMTAKKTFCEECRNEVNYSVITVPLTGKIKEKEYH